MGGQGGGRLRRRNGPGPATKKAALVAGLFSRAAVRGEISQGPVERSFCRHSSDARFGAIIESRFAHRTVVGGVPSGVETLERCCGRAALSRQFHHQDGSPTRTGNLPIISQGSTFKFWTDHKMM